MVDVEDHYPSVPSCVTVVLESTRCWELLLPCWSIGPDMGMIGTTALLWRVEESIYGYEKWNSAAAQLLQRCTAQLNTELCFP